MLGRIVIGAALCAASVSAHAGVKWLSRANCVAGLISESVTYDRPSLASHYMFTQSEHVGFGSRAGHTLTAPWNVTWRSYAGHTGDATRNTVTGLHIFGDDMRRLTTRRTVTTNCNLGEW